MKLIIFVGARPNLMKVAPLCKELKKRGLQYEIYHSGQHYDKNMNKDFLSQLNLEDICHLNCFDENPVKMMQKISNSVVQILTTNGRQSMIKKNTMAVIVVGDVLTTYITALTVNLLRVPLIHIEAGLRSFDISMPEEYHRITTDYLSDCLFASSHGAVDNLHAEGLEYSTYLVGNIMIDCLCMLMDDIQNISPLKNENKEIIVSTFHRPENVDTYYNLKNILEQLVRLSEIYDIIFPVHPRTMKKIKEFKLFDYVKNSKIDICSPMSYVTFMSCVMESKCVVTDSGGIQEETSYLGIPCFTARRNTERPITISEGTNKLISFHDITKSILELKKPLRAETKIPLWDGKASERIVDIIVKKYG